MLITTKLAAFGSIDFPDNFCQEIMAVLGTRIRSQLFQLLSCSPSTTGLTLRFTLICHNSDDLFKAFIDRGFFDHIIELSHKILWEEFRIKTNHKVRPGIKGSVKKLYRPCIQQHQSQRKILAYPETLQGN